MATLLAVYANPKKLSYTRELLQAFLEAYRQSYPADTVVELDLYQMDIPVIDEPVLRAWDKRGVNLSAEDKLVAAAVDRFTEQFITADKLVFAAPMWNLQFPPQLLSYLATIAVAGRSFCYTEDGACQGLVPDKPAALLHVRGGIFSSGPAAAMDHAVPYLRSLFGMLGVSQLQTVICEGVEMDPANARNLLEQAKREAALLAGKF